ncbi:hypothetical protein, partial [Bradyrhizobium ottawaense]|uniref:hypothetical protein n=1 Tax=Bradyrhizobium ottawaense TaxID=931866 RepID=UPI0030C6A95E
MRFELPEGAGSFDIPDDWWRFAEMERTFRRLEREKDRHHFELLQHGYAGIATRRLDLGDGYYLYVILGAELVGIVAPRAGLKALHLGEA